ncbi:MAG: acetyl-CoA carboxylase biotin carboxylase subunit [Rhodobacteraceae bacterium]|nr:acetyl-CoA carboxylase biotin carboxylase subunit [Paracoccaceae bacterium]
MQKIRTLLVANRGEIAVRIFRTAKALGMRTAAVYSDADRDALHVRMADTAICIGGRTAEESYLRADAILKAAKQCGADAIHPGYGFLSENAAFAEQVQASGLIFVGPDSQAIRAMGDKAQSKRAMIEAGVPCVPGYQGEDQSNARLEEAATEIGFPVMIKASAGGGGRGMRVVQNPADFKETLELARSEAENAFGNGALILESAVLRPRHVEIQVFADRHGTVLHLGERDCSVQRRHQKVLEEAPCPVMTPQLRADMGAAAVQAARAVDYVGAGTVEFLLDDQNRFFFLEMNTRLQVEHPVTELVTGLDLVALQLQVAQGLPLGMTQKDVTLTGHAIEARVYAEDPAEGFLPSTGRVDLWQAPEGPGVRVDSGIDTGGMISPFYDSMVAKLIAFGETREIARARLTRAIQDMTLFGPTTNQAFLADALSREEFVNGASTTSFVGDIYGEHPTFSLNPSIEDLAIAATLQVHVRSQTLQAQALDIPDELMGWSSTPNPAFSIDFGTIETPAPISVRRLDQPDAYTVSVADADPLNVAVQTLADHQAILEIGRRVVSVRFKVMGESEIALQSGSAVFRLKDRLVESTVLQDSAKSGAVTAPMHGSLQEVSVRTGQAIQKGDRLAVLEAMKMQHVITSDIDGAVKSVLVAADQQVAAGDLLIEIEPTER